MNKSELSNDDIDLSVFLNALIRQKWVIALFIFLASISGLFYSLSLPNLYTSHVQLMPEKGLNASGSNGLGALSGGLSMLGIGKQGQDNYVSIALKLLEGNNFIGEFLNEHNLEAVFFASKSWEPTSNTLFFNEKLYDGKEWLREETILKGKEPTHKELSENFRSEHLSLSLDDKTGFVSISVSHVSPHVAYSTLNNLIQYINNELRNQAIEKSNKKIAYLKDAISNTSDSEIKTGFINMLVAEEKDKMLASVNTEFVFTVVDPAFLPSDKSGPKRLIILLMFVFFGGFLGVLIALIKEFYFKGKQNEES
ncbi:Wzz/FepE/Etk N-terminal domain-containing protein [Pseudoalteromonas phenolica]|uniref:Wzz/FepE/Etk N-terminal domain-containing protein n=1 Tax=Pseudoalteromonas phenolica TaxID=161398 RepID=UPI00384D9E0A